MARPKPRHRVALVALAAAAWALPARAGDLDNVVNPLEDAEVGEWTEYEITIQTDTTEGTDTKKGTSRMEVVEVEGFRVAIRVTGNLQEGEKIVHLMMSAPYRSLLLGGYDEVKIETSDVERGTLEVSGRTYRVQVVHLVFTATTTVYGMDVPCKVDQRVWVSHDAPVTGLVKQETTVDLELLGQPLTSRTSTVLTASSAK